MKSKFYSIMIRYTSWYVRTFCNLSLGAKVMFKGIPEILKDKSATITIAKNTIINSMNYGYHLNMHSKCKLYAHKPGSKIRIGSNCRIHGTCIHAYKNISIGNNCLIAANTQIFDSNGHKLSFENASNRIHTSVDGKDIVVEDNVWIGTSCIILGGTYIGAGSVISAGSVIKGIVPPNCIFGGNPAKLIKQF